MLLCCFPLTKQSDSALEQQPQTAVIVVRLLKRDFVTIQFAKCVTLSDMNNKCLFTLL